MTIIVPMVHQSHVVEFVNENTTTTTNVHTDMHNYISFKITNRIVVQ